MRNGLPDTGLVYFRENIKSLKLNPNRDPAFASAHCQDPVQQFRTTILTIELKYLSRKAVERPGDRRDRRVAVFSLVRNIRLVPLVGYAPPLTAAIVPSNLQ